MLRSTAVIATATLLAAGCGGGGVTPANFLQPQVQMRQIALRSAGITGGVLDVQLGIANPNHINVDGTKLDASLDLQGQHFGDIASTSPFSLSEQDTTLVTLPLSFKWADLAASAKDILGYGEMNYHLAGHIGVKLPAGQDLEVPFSGDGTVPIVRTLSGSP